MPSEPHGSLVRSPVLERARKELRRGRPWRARSQLLDVLNGKAWTPAAKARHAEARALLAESSSALAGSVDSASARRIWPAADEAPIGANGRRGAVARAHADLIAGQPWKAADRLESLLDREPDRDDVRVLLGTILLELSEPIRAGRALAQTERTDPATEAASAEWLRSLGEFGPFSAPAARSSATRVGLDAKRIERLGPVARARLQALLDARNIETPPWFTMQLDRCGQAVSVPRTPSAYITSVRVDDPPSDGDRWLRRVSLLRRLVRTLRRHQ